jgi:WD40 repeat protein
MKRKTKVISTVLFLSIFIVLVSFGGQKAEWKGKIEKIDGITVIKNPKEPMYSEDVLSVEEELCIGEAREEGKYVFSRLWYLAVDSEENIYAMDQGETHVKVFDKNGMLLRTIGKKGEGPGELLQPNEIFITGDNQLVIEDFIRNLTYYSLDGKYIKAQSTAEIFPIRILVNSQSYILAVTNINDPDKSGQEIGLYDENLNYLKTLLSDPKPKPNPQILVPFQPEIKWALSKDDNIIISYKRDYELQVFNAQGKLTKKITKEYKPVRITKEDVKQRIRRVPEGRKLVVLKFFPAVHSITTDDESRIFVHTYDKAGEGKYYNDVFDSEGRYIARVALKDRIKFWKKNKLYTIEEDEEGYQVAKRYKVTWKY